VKTGAKPGNYLAKVGVEGSSPFARSRFFSNRQSLTKARHVSGLFLSFPAMRSDGHGDSAISRRGSRCDDVVNSRRENLPQLMRSNVRYRIAASAKNASNKTVRKKFLLTLFLLSQGRASRFSPSMDVITFQGLIHLGAGQSSSLERSK
jgi:hypothetical protein